MSCDLLYPKWEAINEESNFVSSFRPLQPRQHEADQHDGVFKLAETHL
jgi:hypothetical protein